MMWKLWYHIWYMTVSLSTVTVINIPYAAVCQFHINASIPAAQESAEIVPSSNETLSCDTSCPSGGVAAILCYPWATSRYLGLLSEPRPTYHPTYHTHHVITIGHNLNDDKIIKVYHMTSRLRSEITPCNFVCLFDLVLSVLVKKGRVFLG